MSWRYNLALKVSEESKHDRHKVGAVVTKGGAVLSAEPNHTAVQHGDQRSSNHAETRALRPHQDFKGAYITIARDGGRASFPCPSCFEKIKAAGIRKIFYFDWEGKLTEFKI